MAFMPDRMRQLMDQKGIGISELARTLKTSNSLVNRYLRGKSEPKGARLAELADALGTSTDYLLNRFDYPERLSDLHYQIWDAFDRGDNNAIIDLLRKHLAEKGLGKKPIARKKPPTT